MLPHHHVARYCRRRDIGISGVPLDTAFYLRSGEEYLSTNWLEHFHESERRSQIEGVIGALAGKGFRVAGGGSFAVLGVGDATSACKGRLDLNVRFVVLGDAHDPSHTGIYGYGERNVSAAALLAALVGRDEVHPART